MAQRRTDICGKKAAPGRSGGIWVDAVAGAKRQQPGCISGRMRPLFLEMPMTLLKFADVSLAYGAMPLLDGVSWQIARG